MWNLDENVACFKTKMYSCAHSHTFSLLSSFSLSLCLSLFLYFWSISSCFPKHVNQQIVNEDLSSKTHSEKKEWEQAQSREMGGVLDQLSVCQNMSTRLSLCLLSPLMLVPQWAPHKDHNTAFALWVSLSCSIKFEQEGDRETAKKGEREINYMFQ